MAATTTVDVTVRNEGSIFTFTPHTQAAKDWISENVSDDAQWFGNSLVVEHRYAENLANGMQGDGLTLE